MDVRIPVLQSAITPVVLLGLALAYATLRSGGVYSAEWNHALVAIALTGIFSLTASGIGSAPPLDPWLRWPLAALPCYVLFQLVPLPVSVLAVLSPARAELARHIPPTVSLTAWVPLSVLPAETLGHLLRIAAFAIVFLVLYEIGWRSRRSVWMVTVPIVAVAAAEGILGLLQWGMGEPGTLARGTYVNRDHFAGFLEMSLPFAVMYPAALLWRGRSRASAGARRTLGACAMITLAVAIFLAILYSFSRMGFIACLFSLFLMGGLALGGREHSWKTWAAALALIGLLIGSGFVFLAPDQLIRQFGKLNSPGGMTTEGRLMIWKETLPLVKVYSPFGCGMGAYVSAFFRFNQTSPTETVDYAHNDYLQLLAELGPVGFAIIATLMVGILVQALRAVFRAADPDSHCLALACTGAISAILLHSFVDFNLYIPANALLLAWISGITAGLQFAVRPATRLWRHLGVPQIVEADR